MKSLGIACPGLRQAGPGETSGGHTPPFMPITQDKVFEGCEGVVFTDPGGEQVCNQKVYDEEADFPEGSCNIPNLLLDRIEAIMSDKLREGAEGLEIALKPFMKALPSAITEEMLEEAEITDVRGLSKFIRAIRRRLSEHVCTNCRIG
jgi:hypothetical protein